MTDDDRIPQSEASGALEPPPSYPSTALAAPAGLPPRPWDDDVIAARDLFARVVRGTFDALDNGGVETSHNSSSVSPASLATSSGIRTPAK